VGLSTVLPLGGQLLRVQDHVSLPVAASSLGHCGALWVVSVGRRKEGGKSGREGREREETRKEGWREGGRKEEKGRI
jgi:hypothetical protein